MAGLEITPALGEIISSLTQEDIPAKLRCTICSRLAVNAYRLPCCDQAICETCHSTLPSSCPVCEHSPVSAADCKPNKSLRTTIKVFLRTEEKKREARLKEAKKNTPPTTPPEPIASPKQTEVKAEGPAADCIVPTPAVEASEAPSKPLNENKVQQQQQADQDIPQPSIEEITPGQEPRPEGLANEVEDGVFVDGDGQITAEDGENDQSTVAPGEIGTSGLGMGIGSAGMPGGFPTIGFGDMNQMQQMQMMMSMQNGMPPAAFGNFPMMGMPGMNMDPMAMQQMMMSGGFGGAGMGMNGMNMGMGMGGFESSAGTGFNNGWNNQQSWNVGQDNYNHQSASGIGHGDYGSNNSGYPQTTGYNQGNYGRGNHYNNYQNNTGFQGRGGRGRGGFGRGGYGYGSNEAFSQQYPQQATSGAYANGTSSETPNVPTGPKANDVVLDPNVDEFGREIRQVSESESKDVAQVEVTQTQKDNSSAKDTTDNSIQPATTAVQRAASEMVTDNGLSHIQTLDDAEGAFNSSYSSYGQKSYSQNGFHGRGASFNAMPPPKPVDVPINAPKGPKAMREGLPNTGISGLKARAFGKAVSVPLVNGNASAAPAAAAAAPSVTITKDRERSRSPTRDRSRSRDRKRSKSRERHHRRHRHRSTSLIDDKDEDTDRRRERRKRHRHEDGDERENTDLGEQLIENEKKDERNDEGRSRSASPSESKRSSHRSRRDREKHRDRERDERDKYRDREDDREHRSSHKHRSSRRHHDDRSRSRDRDREHRHRHSRRGSEETEDRASKTDKSIPPTPVESEPHSRRPSLIPNNSNGLEIKGASQKRKSTIDEIVIPTGPRGDRTSTREHPRDEPKEREKSSRHHDDDRHRSSRYQHEREKDRVKDVVERPKEKERTKSTVSAVQDPHTIEREARNRERLLKEAQRMAGLAGGRKRSRDDTDIKGGLKKRGRGHENEEARIARLEEERESARWT